MFKFSLKNLYDDQVNSCLLVLELFKWISIIITLLGLWLASWFHSYWLAIIGGGLLIIIGSISTLIIYFINKKLAIIVVKGGKFITTTEKYLTDRIKQKFQNVMNKQSDEKE